MQHFLVIVADRSTEAVSSGLISDVRDSVRGKQAQVLSPGEAVEFRLDARPDMAAVRSALRGAPVDAIAVPAQHRRKRLLIADMDSTIVTSETLDELADFAGLKDRIAEITRRAMNGELEFKAALRERVGMLKGLPAETLARTWERIRLTEGARELVATMHANGAVTALVSGGFDFFTARVAAQLGFDFQQANRLLLEGDSLSGKVREPILDRDAKLRALYTLAEEYDIPLAKTLAVGDGANDLDMLGAAGLGVAFRAKPIVAGQAAARVDHAGLRALLFAQGYSAKEIVCSA